MKKTVIQSCTAVLSVILFFACADGSKTQWPRNTGPAVDLDKQFTAKACLANLNPELRQKLSSGSGRVTGREVLTCKYMAGNEPEGDVANSVLPFGKDDYDTLKIKSEYTLTQNEEKQKEFRVRVKVVLPKGSTSEQAKFVEESINQVCAPKIDSVWRGSPPAIGYKIVARAEIKDVESNSRNDFHQTLDLVAKPEGKPGEFAFAIWPYHSGLTLKTTSNEAKYAEPFCQSLARLSAMWLGVSDPFAPKSGDVCEHPDEDEAIDSDSMMLGFENSGVLSATTAEDFWARIKVREDREIKQILKDQCKPKSRPATRDSKKSKANLTSAPGTTTPAIVPVQLETSIE